jgi:peptidoglycan-associated lipoprotein
VPRRALREFTETAAFEDVYFEFDESTIPPAGIQPLNANASWIKGHPDHMILIEGHCDDRGTNDYNLALGERRARSAMNYLVAQGVPATRIVIVSYGEERPACRAPTESCWSKNRRAHFLVYAQ